MVGHGRPYGRADDLVQREIRRGHRAERVVAAVLRDRGLQVTLQPQRVRASYEERAAASDNGFDLLVQGRRVEVKQRAGYRFRGPEDFAYATVWVDVAEDWDRRDPPRAHAYILVSGDLMGFMAVLEDVYPHVYCEPRADPTRQRADGRPALRNAMMIKREYVLDLDAFVARALAWAATPEAPPSEDTVSFAAHPDPSDAELADLADYQRDLKDANRARLRALRERERLARRAIEDAAKRAWIAGGNEVHQPPEYRGVVFEHADRDGVHPTAYPPLRESVGGELSAEFIAFQAHNQTRIATHPQYYCGRCRIRYNARDGGLCGPCLGETQPQDTTARSRRTRTDGPGGTYPT